MVGDVRDLQFEYRLILRDTRGHGASDKPRDPQACTPANFDITSVPDDVGVSKAALLGLFARPMDWLRPGATRSSSNCGLRDGAALRRAPPPPTGSNHLSESARTRTVAYCLRGSSAGLM